MEYHRCEGECYVKLSVISSLTAAGFSSFGCVIETPSRNPDIATKDNRYWDGVVPFRATGIPQVGFLEVYWRPLIVSAIEQHHTHTQAFIPLGGVSLIQVVAPPGTNPAVDPEALRAFFLDGTKGVLLHEGTWHALLFPLAPVAHIMLLLQEGTKEHDMHVVTLPEPVRIEFPQEWGDEGAPRYR